MTWRRKTRSTETPDVDPDRAVHESLLELHGAVRRGVEVRRIAQRLREIQQENGFGPAIRHVYEGGRP